MFDLKKIWPFQKKATTQDIIRELYAGREVRSGVSVTAQTALEVATVYRCVRVLCDSISTIPLRIYKKQGDRRIRAEEHPLYDLFDVEPNPWQDSLEFLETMTAHYALLNNAYAFVNRVRGKIVELIPIEPSRVSVERTRDMEIIYHVTTEAGEVVAFPQETIWHIRGLSWNGWMGLETIKYGREAIGLSMALEQSHAYFHKNGSRPTGVYSVEGTLTPEQYKRLREHISAETAGISSTGRPMILDRAAKWVSLAMTGVDAQHLETRDHQIPEICRFFGVMPIMVGHSDKTATYASAEQMFLAHAIHTARPLHRRFEKSIMRNLMSAVERKQGYYAKFTDTEMLRGAAKDRAEYYAKGINAGWLTRNEAREWEELDPIDGLSEPLSPVNMVVGNPPDPKEDEQNDRDADDSAQQEE